MMAPIKCYVPHPIPYQGSKRLLAPDILEFVAGRHFHTLYEPFAGSAAITLAAATRGVADSYVIADSLCPLMDIWQLIIEDVAKLADGYERIWEEQHGDPDHFFRVRDEYNKDGDPAKLLYLLARCVKNAARFNNNGEFNQSHDKRRTGTRPGTMRNSLSQASALLSGRTTATCGDFEDIIKPAGPGDLVYMDPPYEGTSTGRDRRYHQGLTRERLIAALRDLNGRNVPFLLSYDGRTGEKVYGEPLPDDVGERMELVAGRSSQATLSGRDELTVESLYIWTYANRCNTSYSSHL